MLRERHIFLLISVQQKLRVCISAFEIGGQGDIGEIKIQITTATPDKSIENEAEALQDKDAQKAPGALSVSHTPEGRYICYSSVQVICSYGITAFERLPYGHSQQGEE